MGSIASKLFKPDSKSTKKSNERTETLKEKTEIEDVRSPTANIVRTPIIVDKLKSDLNCDMDHKSDQLRTKLLHKNHLLKLDPRSPTIGIYRTPIIVDDAECNKKCQNFDSPVSIYSNNLSDSFVQDVMTPIEPSVNVSGFEDSNESEVEILLEAEDIKGEENTLKVIDRPNTAEAMRLLDEIILSDEENFLKKVQMPPKKCKKSEIKIIDKKFDGKRAQVKSRTPLSNITSSANSPKQVKLSGKLNCRSKILPECGSENLTKSQSKHLAQWDQNSTVII